MSYTRTVYISDFEARTAIIEIGKSLYAKNFVPADSGGISVRVSPTEIWTTPAAVSKGQLSHGGLLKINLQSKISSGKEQPFPDINAHLRIFAENPEINAIIHAHPPAATAFSLEGKSLESPALSAVFGAAPLAHSAKLDAAAAYCKSHGSVLLAGFGLVTWGLNPKEAYFKMESLEQHALVLLHSGAISGQGNRIPTDQRYRLPAEGSAALHAPAAANVSSFSSLVSQADGCGCGCIPAACIRSGGSAVQTASLPPVKQAPQVFSEKAAKTKEDIIDDVVQSVIARFAGTS